MMWVRWYWWRINFEHRVVRRGYYGAKWRIRKMLAPHRFRKGHAKARDAAQTVIYLSNDSLVTGCVIKGGTIFANPDESAEIRHVGVYRGGGR